MTALEAHDIIREALDSKRITFDQLVCKQHRLLRTEYRGTDCPLAMTLIDVRIATELNRSKETVR